MNAFSLYADQTLLTARSSGITPARRHRLSLQLAHAAVITVTALNTQNHVCWCFLRGAVWQTPVLAGRAVARVRRAG